MRGARAKGVQRGDERVNGDSDERVICGRGMSGEHPGVAAGVQLPCGEVVDGDNEGTAVLSSRHGEGFVDRRSTNCTTSRSRADLIPPNQTVLSKGLPEQVTIRDLSA